MSRLYYRGLLVFLLLFALGPWLLTGWALWLRPQDPLAPADALFVPNGDPDFARVRVAAVQHRRGLARWLIVSGAGIGGDSAQAMALTARKLGVPQAAILIEPDATSTHENAVLSAPLLSRHGIRRVIIVSSPYHLRRMRLAAHRAWPGVEVRTLADEEPFDPYWWLHPTTAKSVLMESGKLATYWLLGK